MRSERLSRPVPGIPTGAEVGGKIHAATSRIEV
jgi:hypothetical protein